MSAKDDKHTDTHTAPAATIKPALHYANLSIAQAIDEAIHDNSKPSEESSLESTLPSDLIKNPGLSQLENQLGRLFSDPSADASKGNATDPLSTLAAEITSARSRLTSLDPTTHPGDPTQTPDIIDNKLPSAAELQSQLASQLGVPAGVLPSDPPDAKNQHTGSHHLERPDGPPTGDPAGTHDPNHGKVEGMLSAGGSAGGSAGHDSWDQKDKQGHVHHWEDHWDGKGNEVVSDNDQKTGKQTITIFHADHSSVKQTTDPAHHTVTTTTTSADGTETTTTAITDKKYWHDGTVTVSQTKPGDPPLEPLADDGNKTGGGAKMPDGDHQAVLPGWLRDQVQKELQAEIKSMHLPTHEGDDINVRDDVPGTVSQGDLTGGSIDKFHNILGGDTFNNAGIWQDRGSGAGAPPQNYNGIAGAIDFGPDHDETPQSSGREERNTQHPIHTDPTAHAGGSGDNGAAGNAQNDSGNHDSAVSGFIETAAQQAARDLQAAVLDQNDPWGTQARYEQAANSPANIAETPAQKAAHEVEDAAAQHSAPNQDEPIKPHEKLPGPDLGGIFDHGPGHGAGSQPDGAGFAELIRVAENPKEFGLISTAHAAGTDVLPHLAVNGDLGGHAVNAHIDETHVTGVPLPSADMHVDHYGVAPPVVDHFAHH